MTYIACYVVRVGRKSTRHWLRDECSPNAREFATRFDTVDAADAELDRICEGWRGRLDIRRTEVIPVE